MGARSPYSPVSGLRRDARDRRRDRPARIQASPLTGTTDPSPRRSPETKPREDESDRADRKSRTLEIGREHASDPAAAGAPVRRRALVQPQRLRLSKAEAASAPRALARRRAARREQALGGSDRQTPSLVGSSRSSPRQTV